MPKFRSCHKAIMVITGRAHCYTFCIYIYNRVYLLFSKIRDVYSSIIQPSWWGGGGGGREESKGLRAREETQADVVKNSGRCGKYGEKNQI